MMPEPEILNRRVSGRYLVDFVISGDKFHIADVISAKI
jgi:hypothetical protein